MTLVQDRYEAALQSAVVKEKNKKNKYNGDILGQAANSVFRLISKYDLTVPIDQYQRDRRESVRAKDIAALLDVVAFGALTVIERSSGQLVIADGGTRWAATMLRDDVHLIPCRVFRGLTPEQEAETFRRINVDRDKLRVSELHHAELFAGKDLAVEVDAIMNELTQAGVEFSSLGVMRTLHTRKPKQLREIKKVLLQVAVGRRVSAKILKGLVYIQDFLMKRDESLNTRKMIGRIEKVGLHGMETAITAFLPQSASGNTKLYGTAIAKVLHIRLPTKD